MSIVAAFTSVIAAPASAAATTTTTTRTTTALTEQSSIAPAALVTFVATRGSGKDKRDPDAAASSSRQRKRHSKRHSLWKDNENNTALEWVNPCGGFYMPLSATESRRAKRKNARQIYNMLKKSAGNEYKTLKDSSAQVIDISNIQMWSLHNKTYKFLPKLKSNSTIALERWYRNMQTYIASFAYLRRKQLKWDLAKLQCENSTARELKNLLRSSRSILCELEMAINGTLAAHRSGRKQLPQVSRAQMNKRLKLYTKRSAERNAHLLQEPNSIDLKWVKYLYYDFLETMWKVLRKYTKRRGQVALHGNRKEFNEVEKHFGSVAPSGALHDGSSTTRGIRQRNRQQNGRWRPLRVRVRNVQR